MMMFRIVAKTQAQETAAYVTTKQPLNICAPIRPHPAATVMINVQ
jgi:hypothetical protein